MGWLVVCFAALHPLTAYADPVTPPGSEVDGDAGQDSDAEPTSDAEVTGEPDLDADKPEAEDDRFFIIRYLDALLGMPDDPTKPRFIAYPVAGYAPETSWEFGLSALYVYYAEDNPSNRLSES